MDNDNKYSYRNNIIKNISYLIQENIFTTSKWLKYEDIFIYYDIVKIFEKIDELYVVEEYHLVVTYIYFKRLLNIGNIHNKPFFIFLLSFILCIKFWSEASTVCMYPPVYIKNLLKYELHILVNTNFSFHISESLFNDTYSVLFYDITNMRRSLR